MWTTQTRNQGRSVKLVVWYHPWTGRPPQTFHAFLGEEKKGTAISGLTRRILHGKCAGQWRTAIFYRDGVEVERWREGHKTNEQLTMNNEQRAADRRPPTADRRPLTVDR